MKDKSSITNLDMESLRFSLDKIVEAVEKGLFVDTTRKESKETSAQSVVQMRNEARELENAYGLYHRQLKRIELMPFDEQLKELHLLYYDISCQYDPPMYSEEAHTYADELMSPTWGDESKENPPFSSLTFDDPAIGLEIAKAKMLYVYYKIQNQLGLTLRCKRKLIKNKKNMDTKTVKQKKIKKYAEKSDWDRLNDLYYNFSRVVYNIVFYLEKTKKENTTSSELKKYRGLVYEWSQLHNKTERYKIPAVDFEDGDKSDKILEDVGYPSGWNYDFEELLKFVAISDDDFDAVLAGGLDHWWIELTDDGIAKGELLYSLFCHELEAYMNVLGERLWKMGVLKDEDMKPGGLHMVDLSRVHITAEQEEVAKMTTNNQQQAISAPPSSRQAIYDELMSLVEKGAWANGIAVDDIKSMLASVLGMGEKQLSNKEQQMSKSLWHMLERGRGGDRVRLTWQNIIGFLWSNKLLDAPSAPKLNMQFFGDKVGSDNINKGRNGRLSEIEPLLDKYMPKIKKQR